MGISKQLVNDMHDKCGLPDNVCRAALKESAGDIDAAIKALIDSGKVKPLDLNPETVSDELFSYAAREQKLAMYRRYAMPDAGLVGMIGKLKQSDDPGGVLKGMAGKLAALKAAQIGNKTPEQMLAEDEAKEAARLKEVYKTLPGLAGKTPPTAGEQARQMARTKRRGEWLEANPFTLKLPPFPTLKREMHEWTGRDVLEAWAGTQERHGGYTSRSSKKRSKGSVMLQIPRIGEDDANPKPPAPEQVAAYAYFKENQAEITETIMAALLKFYTKLRRTWLKNNPEMEAELPEIHTTAEMRRNVGLGTLHMFDVAKKGHAYFGLELGCTWDEEHGAGVVLHRGRVVDVGQGDTGFDTHAAAKDGGVELGK